MSQHLNHSRFKFSFSVLLICVQVLISKSGNSQNVDSLKNLLKTSTVDSTKLRLMVQISEFCEYDEILGYTEPAIRLAEQLYAKFQPKDKVVAKSILNYKALALNNTAFLYTMQNKIALAIEYNNRSLETMKQVGNLNGISSAYSNIGNNYVNISEYDKALSSYLEGLKYSEQTADKKGIARAFNNIGSVYQYKGENAKALEYYKKSINVSNEIKETGMLATALGNMAVIYYYQGDVPTAIDFHSQSLKLSEKMNNKDGAAGSAMNLANIYKNQGDNEKAVEYYLQALKAFEKTGNAMGIAGVNNGLGTLYDAKKNYATAIKYYKIGLNIQSEIGDRSGEATSCLNIAMALANMNKLDSSMYYSLRCLNISRSIEKDVIVSFAYNTIAGNYFLRAKASTGKDEKRKYVAKALVYSDSSCVISATLGFPENMSRAEKLRSEIAEYSGDYEQAIIHYKKYIQYRDSINNEKTRKASVKSQLKSEFEKKEAVLKEKQSKEIAIAEEKNRLHTIIIWAVVAGLILVLIFAAFIFRTLKTTKRQKLIIEEKQKEILDSIYYARRIQRSLLPNKNFINKTLERLKNST